MSCGKTIGHGETCQPDYLCGDCERIKDLEAEVAKLRDLVSRQNTGWAIDAAAMHYLREAAQNVVDASLSWAANPAYLSEMIDELAKALKPAQEQQCE